MIEKEARTGNRRLAQWRVKWLIEHSTSHQLLWVIDSFVLRNPPLRQAPNRCAQVYKDNDTADNLLLKDRKRKNEIMNSQRTKQHICKPHKPTHDRSLQKSCFLADAPTDNCIFGFFN